MDPVAIGSAIVSVLALTLGMDTYVVNLQSAARAALQDLTTGDVAKARDLLGEVSRDPNWLARSPNRLYEVRQAWFTILWSIARAEATRQQLERSRRIAWAANRLFRTMIQPQVKIIAGEAPKVRSQLAGALLGRGQTLDDGDALEPFRSLVHASPGVTLALP